MKITLEICINSVIIREFEEDIHWENPNEYKRII